MLSVLLLCWRHRAYLDQCIHSLVQQTQSEFEIVFLDNASDDGSFEQAEALFAGYGLQATMVRNGEPKGISHNLNRLLEASTGDLIAPLSTDDWYAPGYVAAMVESARSNPAAGWFASRGWLYFDETGRTELAPVEAASDDVLHELLQGRSPFFFVGCCYRREALLSVGGWDERQLVEDRDLFVRLAARYPLARLAEPLATYRRSVQAASANPDFMARGWEAFFAKHAGLFGNDLRRRKAELFGGTAAIAVDQQRFGLASRLLVKALLSRPAHAPAWRTLGYLLRSAARSAGGRW